MYENILGQYYDCVYLLPEDIPRRSRPPNHHVSMRQLQLQFQQPEQSQWTQSTLQDVNCDTPENGASPDVVCERLEDEAAKLIRDVAVAGDSGRTSGEEAQSTAVEEARPPKQEEDTGREEKVDAQPKDDQINEYSELERILTTFIYEAPKKTSRL